jgi:glucans biosynthesis protein C
MIVESGSADQLSQRRIADSTTRYHALDHLRATMMLLGVLFHSFCCYTTLPIPWIYKDPSANRVFDLPILLIHTFRMPIFFLLAGFFAQLSWERSGFRAFLHNRIQRILIPFLISWPVLFVATRLTFLYLVVPVQHLPNSAAEHISATEIGSKLRTLHLWFLYYLFFIYPAFLFIAAGFEKYVSLKWKQETRIIVAKSFCSPWNVFIFATPTCILLLATRTALIETDGSFLPNPVVLLSHFVFFGAGCLLYVHRSIVLPTFTIKPAIQTLLGAATAVVYFLCLRAQRFATVTSPRTLHAMASVFGAISIWLFIFGITGLFLRYANRPSQQARYLSEASYWIYIIHPPIVVWMAVAIGALPLPVIVKLLTLFTIVTPLLLASYKYFIRNTLIGRVLNGTSRLVPAGDT